jgi:hypothetical protein
MLLTQEYNSFIFHHIPPSILNFAQNIIVNAIYFRQTEQGKNSKRIKADIKCIKTITRKQSSCQSGITNSPANGGYNTKEHKADGNGGDK